MRSPRSLCGAAAEKFLEGNGRVLVRATGTRASSARSCEAPTDELCASKAVRLCSMRSRVGLALKHPRWNPGDTMALKQNRCEYA